ncbi:MAG: DUF1622 domain-containing protein [marine benthic group bacterium]|nr:DUF1622 domain-containing protein [Gemmatimonadota bacterium]
MVEQIVGFLERAAGMISLFGVVVIAVGFLIAAGRFAAGYRRLGPDGSFGQFKVGLGRALLLGLEILVVSDVLETITVRPTFGSLAALAVLVILRTVVSWTLTLEVEGHWPWQPAGQE